MPLDFSRLKFHETDPDKKRAMHLMSMIVFAKLRLHPITKKAFKKVDPYVAGVAFCTVIEAFNACWKEPTKSQQKRLKIQKGRKKKV